MSFSSSFRKRFPRPLLVCLCSVQAASAALSDVWISPPETPDIVSGGFNETVDLSTGRDWWRHSGGGNTTKKSGATELEVTRLGSFSPGTFLPAAGFQFTWSGGSPTASGTSRTHENGKLPNLGGWQAEVSGLPAGSYKLEFWGARTRASAFSVELYDGDAFLVRRTVDGAPGNTGTNTGSVRTEIHFTVDGPSDVARVRFIRDTTHGVNSTVSDPNILAAGAWRLSEAATAPEIEVTSTISFSGTPELRTLGISYRNAGGRDPLVIQEIVLGGPDAGYVEVEDFNASLAAGESGGVSLAFDPADGARRYEASLTIHSNDPVTPTAVVDIEVDVHAIHLGRLLCIGDSITEGDAGRTAGNGNHSWRYPFWKLLEDHGVGHRFIGTRTANRGGASVYPDYLGRSFANRHEAIWGTSALERGNNAPVYLNALAGVSDTPECAVVFLGGNDMPVNLSLDAATVRDRIKVIVDRLQEANPGVRVLLVSILPRFTGSGFTTPDVRNARFGEINDLLRVLAEEETSAASKVMFLDVGSAFAAAPDWFYDGVHPNGAGESVLARAIFRALVPDRDLDGLPDDWEERYFQNLEAGDGSDDYDGDGASDLEEFLFGTDPTRADDHPLLLLEHAESRVRFTLPAASGPGYEGLTRHYEIQESENLIDWHPLFSGEAAGVEVSLPVEFPKGRRFYRLHVELK